MLAFWRDVFEISGGMVSANNSSFTANVSLGRWNKSGLITVGMVTVAKAILSVWKGRATPTQRSETDTYSRRL